MQVKIKSISLQFFKGVKSATYQFDGKNVSVIGQNGAGKSTIATAWYWVFANCDTNLHNNPAIFPLDIEECTPTVRIWLNCGGKSVEVAKMQKRTVKKSKTGGADTISQSNSYEVNSVEYGERDFKKKMAEYGFDFDLFLPLSHPDVFTSQKSADMRKVLFGMASEQSDYEIACDTKGAQNAALLLENYNAEEVKAMQNATLRKIREEYGKDGEILRAKIEGMEQSKTDIDVAELELQKNSLNEQIADNKTRQEDISKEFEEQQKASDGILELKFELNDLQRKANEENNHKRRELEEEISSADTSAQQHSRTIVLANDKIVSKKRDLESYEKEIFKCGEERGKVNALEFDEKSLVCEYCGQNLPEDKKKGKKEEFSKKKSDDLARISEQGNGWKQRIKETKADIERLEKTVEIAAKQKELAEKRSEELEEQLEKLPQSIDISDRPEVQEIQRQIAEKEAAINKGNNAEKIRKDLRFELNDLQNHLVAVEKQLALAQKNVEIDEQIAALRKKQGEFEQNKADAEKILYQLDLVSRKKNTLLQDDVNSHFKLVKFRLFDYLKNGSVVDDCEPTIDGKSLKDHSNGALRVLAKLDIVDGLQKFYGQHYPVFAEDFSLVTDNTECRIDMDCQLIKLVAEKGVKELKIEVEG